MNSFILKEISFPWDAPIREAKRKGISQSSAVCPPAKAGAQLQVKATVVYFRVLTN